MNRTIYVCGLIWIALATAGTAAAATTYLFTVDTNSVNGTSGFLDFQFNPGNPTSQAATAEILSFTGGSLGGSPDITGDVSGTLPGTVTLTNSSALNEYFQQFTYGDSLSFLLSLTGPALSSPNGTANAGTVFGLGLYDETQSPILTDQGSTTGFAGQVDLNLDGSTTATAFPNGNQPGVVTIQTVPEPATGMLVLCAGLAVFAFRRKLR